VESTLAPGEQIRHRARYHWWHYRAAILVLLLGVLLGAAALYARDAAPDGGATSSAVGRLALLFGAIAGFLFVLRYVQASAVEMMVTSLRAIRKRGIFRREVEQAALSKVQDVSLRQGLLGRALGFATVTVETGTETGALEFANIREPEALRAAVWANLAGPGAAAAGASVQQRLEALELLRGRGLVSEAEYTDKRRQILDSL
jgi:membrane protein YdbS with pleckstrin-like domain